MGGVVLHLEPGFAAQEGDVPVAVFEVEGNRRIRIQDHRRSVGELDGGEVTRGGQVVGLPLQHQFRRVPDADGQQANRGGGGHAQPPSAACPPGMCRQFGGAVFRQRLHRLEQGGRAPHRLDFAKFSLMSRVFGKPKLELGD